MSTTFCTSKIQKEFRTFFLSNFEDDGKLNVHGNESWGLREEPLYTCTSKMSHKTEQHSYVAVAAG